MQLLTAAQKPEWRVIASHQLPSRAGAARWRRSFALWRIVFLLTGLGWLAFSLVSVCQAGEAEPPPFYWEMEADRITHFHDRQEVEGEGGVLLQRAGPLLLPMEIRADRIGYGLESGLIDAAGGLEMRMGQDVITASEARLDLGAQTGLLRDTTVFLADHNLHFTAASVEKTGPASYRFHDGWVTSCEIRPGKPTPWGIQARDMRLTLDEYAVLRHATLRIRDLPVLYTPYLVLPAKISRQTGLLFPEITNSQREGFGLAMPLFINLSPSMDMTLVPGHLSARGTLLGTEFRYAAGPRSLGSVAFTYLQDHTEDTQGDDYRSDGFLRTDYNRYWLRGKADHVFGNEVTMRFDVDKVSDPDYLHEFRGGMLGFDVSHATYVDLFHRGLQEASIPFRESTLQLSKEWPSTFLGAEVRGVDDTGYTHRYAVVPEFGPALHTLPRLLLEGRSRLPVEHLGWEYSSEYVYFLREEGLGGHRLDLRPALTASLPLGPFFEGRMESGVRETLYQIEQHGDIGEQWSADRLQGRSIYDFSSRVASLMFRDFDLGGVDRSHLRHLIRPSVGYVFTSQADQTELPDFDVLDRLEQRNGIEIALHQFFSLNGVRPDGAPFQRNLGFVKIHQDYDLHEGRRDLATGEEALHPWSDIFFDLDLRPIEELRFRYLTELNVYGEGVPNYEFRTRYHSQRGNRLALDYRYIRGTAHQLDFSLGTRLSDRLFAEASTALSLSADRIVSENLRLIYHPSCWSMVLETARTEEDQRFMVIFSLDGIGTVFEWGSR